MAHSPEELAVVQNSLREAQEFARPGYYYHYDESDPANPEKLYRVGPQAVATDKTTMVLNVHYTAEYPPYSDYIDPPIIFSRPLFSSPHTPAEKRDGFADPVDQARRSWVGQVVLRRFNFYKPLEEPGE